MDQINASLKLLGLDPEASPEAAKQAYRDLVRVWHPDRFGADQRLQQKAEEKIKEINDAYEVVQAYIFRKAALHAGSPGGPGPTPEPPSRPPRPWDDEELAAISRQAGRPDPNRDRPDLPGDFLVKAAIIVFVLMVIGLVVYIANYKGDQPTGSIPNLPDYSPSALGIKEDPRYNAKGAGKQQGAETNSNSAVTASQANTNTGPDPKRSITASSREIESLLAKAGRGDLEAQANLGVKYTFGFGVERNYAEAIKWYRMAADSGHPAAQLNLGLMYANGQGTTRDLVEAYKWCLLAAERDPSTSVAGRDTLVRKLSREELEEAQRRATEFVLRKGGQGAK
jgi:TPR repeat protein